MMKIKLQVRATDDTFQLQFRRCMPRRFTCDNLSTTTFTVACSFNNTGLGEYQPVANIIEWITNADQGFVWVRHVLSPYRELW